MTTEHLKPEVLADLAEQLPVEVSSREHLARCTRCAAHVKELASTLSAARALDVPEPESAYWADFSSRLERRIQHESKRRPMRWALAAAAAAMLCSVFLARDFWRGGANGVEPTEALLPPVEEDAEFQFLVSVADFAEPDEDWETLTSGLFSTADLSSLTGEEGGLLVEKLKQSLEARSGAKS